MSTKNVYLFKVDIRDTQDNREVPITQLKQLFNEIFNLHNRNNALKLTRDDVEPIILDILENTDKYLFARLSNKRPNNSLQKRNYNDFSISDVLGQNEVDSNGIELFTYCILGYSHGILSVVNSRGTPKGEALARIFQIYNNRYTLETTSIPNQDLINELLDGKDPEINRITVDLPRPSAQIMQQIFGFNERETLEAIQGNTTSIIFEVKPEYRGNLCNDTNLIKRLIDAFRKNRNQYTSVILSGKPNGATRQRAYDLYEEYFKYPISVSEYRFQNGKRVENAREEILRDYRKSMMLVYDDYKDVILAVCDR